MERTYDVFIDNGLFVLAYHLDKNIEDVTEEDIKNSLQYFEELYKNTVKESPKYSSMAYSSFQNSSYTQKAKNVAEQLQDILSKSGKDDTCCKCGKQKVRKEGIGNLTRSLFPTLTTNKLFNFSNNLQQINVCPTCIALAILSYFNITPIMGMCMLMSSEDDEFMYDYTIQRDEARGKAMILHEEKDKKVENKKRTINGYTLKRDTIKSMIANEKIYDGYIENTLFLNSSQGEALSKELITKKDYNFIKYLIENSLISKFESEGLFVKVINGSMRKNYLMCLVNDKFELRCSREMFDIVEKEYSTMKESEMLIVKKIIEKIKNNNKINKPIQELRLVDNLNKFEVLLLKWIEIEPNLVSLDEFDKVCNYKIFRSVRNRILVELINNN